MGLFNRFKRKPSSKEETMAQTHQQSDYDSTYGDDDLFASREGYDSDGMGNTWEASESYGDLDTFDSDPIQYSSESYQYEEYEGAYNDSQSLEAYPHTSDLYDATYEGRGQDESHNYGEGKPGNYRLDRPPHASNMDENYESIQGHRAKYSYRIDKFLNNGIILLGILLLIVLLIAFIV